MKKLLLTICCVLAVTFGLSAQNAFKKGDNVVNFGLGLGTNLYGSGESMKVPPLSASYELGIKDHLWDEKSSLGVGGYVGYSASQFEQTIGRDNYGWDYSHFIIGVRGNVHYQFVDKLDTYGGLMLGYDIVSSSSFGSAVGKSTADASAFAWSLYAGGRYYFTEKFAVMAELGYGVSYLNVGVALKF